MNTIGQKIIFDSDCTIGGANGVLSRGMQWRGLCARIQTDPAAKMCMLICDWCEECILLTLRTLEAGKSNSSEKSHKPMRVFGIPGIV